MGEFQERNFIPSTRGYINGVNLGLEIFSRSGKGESHNMEGSEEGSMEII